MAIAVGVAAERRRNAQMSPYTRTSWPDPASVAAASLFRAKASITRQSTASRALKDR